LVTNSDKTGYSMDLASRIQALEDIEAIKRLKYDYFYFCDSKQPDRVRACSWTVGAYRLRQ